MNVSDKHMLGGFFKEVISWRWDDFCKAEVDGRYTSLEATVFSLVRICAHGRLAGIKTAISRIDGNLETAVQLIYPEVYYLYPEATSVATPSIDVTPSTDPATTGEALPPGYPSPQAVPLPDEPLRPVATWGLRETLEKMGQEPRILVHLIIKRKEEIEAKKLLPYSKSHHNVPLVKSVIVANLLRLVEQYNYDAIAEVFNQIDGKLLEKIKVFGEDMYITNYATVAPVGATKNDDGVYCIKAEEATAIWKNQYSKNSSIS
jgi:hypothetical protein